MEAIAGLERVRALSVLAISAGCDDERIGSGVGQRVRALAEPRGAAKPASASSAVMTRTAATIAALAQLLRERGRFARQPA